MWLDAYKLDLHLGKGARYPVSEKTAMRLATEWCAIGPRAEYASRRFRVKDVAMALLACAHKARQRQWS